MIPVLAETAYAKINLALHVRRRRDDGYHDIETLFAFAENGDRISVEPAEKVSLRISGPFADGLCNTDNLVVKAAQLMQAECGVTHGASIYLDKRLPVASGIGGGSADAAATARVLNRLWAIGAEESELATLLRSLGADVPACVGSRTAFGEGTGAALQAVPDSEISGKPILLVNPRVPVATGPVFKAWDGRDRGALDHATPWQSSLAGRNDLQDAAMSICPAINDVLVLLAQTDAELVRMSGSGATCFALFPSAQARDSAQAFVVKSCPEYWTMGSCLR